MDSSRRSAAAALIAAHHRDWGFVPHVEREVFGTLDPHGIATAVDGFCVEHLGAGIERYELYAASVGSVHGVRLRDGRRVAVKIHSPVGAAGPAVVGGVADRHLEAVRRVQAHLVAHGFPSPEPLLGPTPLAAGTAIVEALLVRGRRADAHEPPVRRLTARTLARLVELCRPLLSAPDVGAALSRGPQPTSLWPVPHDRRFDFERTAEGAEWIDRLAAEAHARCRAAPGRLVIGHNDWRVEHLRFEDDRIVAVYDWDSLIVEREPILVGHAAHAFTADWSVEGLRCVPALEECRAFVAEYEDGRGQAFTAPERAAVDAGLVAAAAYGARCEHSDARTAFGTGPLRPAAAIPSGTFRDFLARHGTALLGVAD